MRPHWQVLLGLVFALLLLIATTVHGQTSVQNVAGVTPPTGVVNTNPSPSCTGGVCSAQDVDAVTPSADLSLSKFSSNPNVAVGQTVTFTLTISNVGPSPVVNASFTDVVPVNFTAVTVLSSTGGAIASVSGNTVSGTTSLASGATSSVVVQAVASSTGAYTNAATVAPPPGTNDPVSTNNTGTQTGLVIQLFADVTTEVDLPASAPAGTVVTGTVVFTNSAAAGATASAVVGTVTLSNGDTFTYTVGELAPGASVTQTFTTTVPSTLGTVLDRKSVV